MIDTDELERTREANGPGNFVYIICEEYLSARKRIEEIESENKRLKDTVTGLDAHADRCLAEKNLHVQMILDKQFNQGLLEAKLGVASAKHDTLCDKLAIAKDAIHDAYGYFRHQNDYYGARMEEALEKIGKVEPK